MILASVNECERNTMYSHEGENENLL